jgi:imidazolonepropionase-like amidohydrolase
VDQIHHGAFIDEAAVRGIRDKDLFYMPTLAVTSQRNIEALSDQPWQTREMQQAQPGHRAGVRLAHQLGVRLGVGCDYPGTPRTWRIGDRTLYELQELVQCGLTPMEAIVAATRHNAEAYRRLHELGTLEPGKRADLLVVAGNPATDVSILYDAKNIRLVMKDGAVEVTEPEYQRHYRTREELG